MWRVVGQELKVHNSFWGWSDDEYSTCHVAGYVGKHVFAAGNTSQHTYVIECEGIFYPARHSTIAGALVDAATKQRIRKAALPKLL